MASRKKILAGIGIGIALVVTVHVIVRRKKNAKKIDTINKILDGTMEDPSNKQGAGQKVINQDTLAKLPIGKFPLKVGDKNRKVYDLQKIMNTNYGTNLDLDGAFGQGMYSALCKHYWNFCGSSVGYYGREISQSDFDEIKNTRR